MTITLLIIHDFEKNVLAHNSTFSLKQHVRILFSRDLLKEPVKKFFQLCASTFSHSSQNHE